VWVRREYGEHRSYRHDRIGEVERELAESETILVEVPDLKEMYTWEILSFR
jgi:hypothetical protein